MEIEIKANKVFQKEGNKPFKIVCKEGALSTFKLLPKLNEIKAGDIVKLDVDKAEVYNGEQQWFINKVIEIKKGIGTTQAQYPQRQSQRPQPKQAEFTYDIMGEFRKSLEEAKKELEEFETDPVPLAIMISIQKFEVAKAKHNLGTWK